MGVRLDVSRLRMGVRLDVSRLRMGVRLDVSRLRMGAARSRSATSVDACELVRARTLFGGRRLKLDDTDLNVFETLRFTALSIDPVFLKNDGFLATTGVCWRRSFASVDAFGRRMIIFFLLRLRGKGGTTQSGTHLDGITLDRTFFAFLILGGLDVTLRLLERLLRLDLERLRLLLAGILHTCSSSDKGL